MPTIVTHAIASCALGDALRPGPSARERWPRGFFALVALAAVMPDADVIAYDLGLEYGHMFGHRGFSHSLVCAALIGAGAALWLGRGARRDRLRLFVVFALATASHGLLDACADDGLGVAFFAPFSGERYFFPWRPLEVAPIGGHGFFITAPLEGGLRWIEVFRSEIVWVWLPALLGHRVVRWLRSRYADPVT